MRETKLDIVTPEPVERRAFARKRVLLGGVIAETNGDFASACTIRNISARGANIHFSGQLPLDKEIYLLDARNQIAYLAKVAWTRADQAGLEFIRYHDIDSALPDDLRFLGRLLIEAKLGQVRALLRRHVPLEEAASAVGLTEAHLELAGRHKTIATEYRSLLDQLRPLLEMNGGMSTTPRGGSGHGKPKLFKRLRLTTQPES